MSSTADVQSSLEPSSVCVYSWISFVLTSCQGLTNSKWYETGYREKAEGPPSESLSQQEAASFPCLAVTSSCEAIMRIASVFIGKYF